MYRFEVLLHSSSFQFIIRESRLSIKNSSGTFDMHVKSPNMFDFFIFLFSGFLSLGYSTPFLSLGQSYMYSSLAAAKAAVISVGEEIATTGLPSRICPLVFVFTGAGNGTANFCYTF